jgi:hypothetical protein
LKGHKNFQFHRIRKADCARCRNGIEKEGRIRGKEGKGCDKRRIKEKEENCSLLKRERLVSKGQGK